jgi:SulP family sulfate permease
MIKRALGPAMVGLIAGIDNLGASLAFAALLFPGALSAGLGMGVGVLLLSGVVLALVIALRSKNPNTIAMVQETSIAILAAAIIGVTGAMTAPTENRIATVFAILGTSTVLSGALLWGVGRARLGALVRFLPYPVVAGFLAGSGWLLIEGALAMMTGQQALTDMLPDIAQPLTLAKIIPATVFALLMLLALRKASHPLTASAVLACAAGTFFALLALFDIPIEQARGWAWLPTTPAEDSVALPSPLWVIGAADWSAVLQTTPAMISAALLTMIGLLLNTSGLELATGRDIEPNGELRSSGVANMLVGFLGGTSGFVGLGMTLLADKLSIHGRSAGIATAVVLAIGLLCAPILASLMPTFLAAGLMIFLGLELLLEWVVLTRRTLPLGEWLAVVAILVAIMTLGFLVGLALGLAISIAVFVYTYSRLPVIRLIASGVELRSSVDRAPAASHLLDSEGRRIHVLQLQGYLFFGTVEQVVTQANKRLHTARKDPLRFLILDLRGVSGVDSAATSGFVKICTTAQAEQVTVIFCHLQPDLEQALCRAGLVFAPSTDCQTASDLDHALEQCEETLLRESDPFPNSEDILFHLQDSLGTHRRLPDMISAMERLSLSPGTELIRAGDAADDVYFLGQGRVKVQVSLPNGRTLRLRTMTSGAVVGEIALYLGDRRTANVIVETPSILYRLSRADLEQMEQNDSDLAVLFHRLLAITLSEKLVLANRLIQVAQ